jgi:hypothetical protein
MNLNVVSAPVLSFTEVKTPVHQGFGVCLANLRF